MDDHPLDYLIEQYLNEKDITKGSFELYKIILNQYRDYIKEHNITSAKKTDVVNYINLKKRNGYSDNWLYHQVQTIKAFYKYLSLNQFRLNLPEAYAFDITESIKNVSKKPRTSNTVLTVEQAKQLLIQTKENRKYIWHYRDYAIIYLMLLTGLRGVEIRRAMKKNLKVVNQETILYIQGKGKSQADTFVRVSKGVREAIEDYLLLRKDMSPFLFISHSNHTKNYGLDRTFFNLMFKRVLKMSGLEDVHLTPHSLRHTAATLNLLSGGSIEDTKDFLRHENMTSTLIYAHHLERLEDDSSEKLENCILGTEE